MSPDTPRDAAAKAAERFLKEESQFHLGGLTTEQSHPKTRSFSQTIAADTPAGAAQLLCVDKDLLPKAEQVFRQPEFARLVDSVKRVAREGRRITFSGCGATGRLAIILERLWRGFWEGAAQAAPEKQERYRSRAGAGYSIMTGGDRALIRSVENFEDYQSFGRRQVRDAGLDTGDLLIAITEGGETSSVIGTAWEAAERGLEVFFVFNNPTEVLASLVERSRAVIEDPRIIKLDLATGPMALSGSTRLQATTMEMLVVGAALEMACAEVFRAENAGRGSPLAAALDPAGYVAAFGALVDQLSTGQALDGLAGLIDLEASCYAAGGRITYLGDDYLLDIVSDTTERTPTFMLPPFRRAGDLASPPSWAFVKDPERPTRAAWDAMLGRRPRGLSWTASDYKLLGGSERMVLNPPILDLHEIYSYAIGNEPDASRWEAGGSILLLVNVGKPPSAVRQLYMEEQGPFFHRAEQVNIAVPKAGGLPLDLPQTPMQLLHHLAVKLVLNTLSTGTMGKLGRIRGNWMIQVDATNKKLIDRATRIIAELGGLGYEEACLELHQTLMEEEAAAKAYRDSAVVRTLKRLGRFSEV